MIAIIITSKALSFKTFLFLLEGLVEIVGLGQFLFLQFILKKNLRLISKLA